MDQLSDVIHICWNDNKYHWNAVVDKSIIVNTKLNTSKFKFSNTLPKDYRGIPTEKKFRNNNCAIHSYYLGRLSPNNGSIVEKITKK